MARAAASSLIACCVSCRGRLTSFQLAKPDLPGTMALPIVPHRCPSWRRGWYWCEGCQAFRYANPSAWSDTEQLSCWRCGGVIG